MSVAGTCLQLDVGNSSAKWRLLRSGEVLRRGRYVPGEDQTRKALLECASELQQIWVSSVAAPEAEQALEALLRDHWGVQAWFARTEAISADLRNSYEDPSRMGVDRWLAMLAARERMRDRICVVDAGSALTIDIVSAGGLHEGGYIIPGPALMERALLLDTDRVRFADEADYGLDPGRSTAEAVRHGIALAQVGALATVLEREGINGPDQVFFCGGGGETLMELSARGGTLAPDLVFEGLAIMAGLHC